MDDSRGCIFKGKKSIVVWRGVLCHEGKSKITRAPGVVKLFGEHAVVHGSTAHAVSPRYFVE